MRRNLAYQLILPTAVKTPLGRQFVLRYRGARRAQNNEVPASSARQTAISWR
jgi:Arc/MetJ family transcription regulator